jgi:guanylate kinase
MSKQGVLTVISGFSGAGKGTVVKALVQKYDYCLSISATTRKPRVGEEHGKEYFFLTREEFESMISHGELIEWAEYVGNYYGTPMKYVREQLEQGKDVLLEIEIQGALKIKELFPEALLLFVTPPNMKELERRLIGRGTEELSVVKKRLARAVEEAVYMEDYDYIIINDELADCVEQINQIIVNDHFKTGNSMNFVKEIKNELMAFKEGDK